jgi:hypothetical protein
MYFVCTSLPFPSTDSLLLLLLRERERSNFTYPRELIEIKATNRLTRASRGGQKIRDEEPYAQGNFTSLHFNFQNHGAAEVQVPSPFQSHP